MNHMFDADSASLPVALALFKVEGLAAYSKRHGRRTAEAALRALQNCLHHAFRRQEATLRCSEDEFAMLLPAMRAEFTRERATLLLQGWACLRLGRGKRYVAPPRLFFGVAQALNDIDGRTLIEAARADLSRSGGSDSGHGSQ